MLVLMYGLIVANGEKRGAAQGRIAVYGDWSGVTVGLWGIQIQPCKTEKQARTCISAQLCRETVSAHEADFEQILSGYYAAGFIGAAANFAIRCTTRSIE